MPLEIWGEEAAVRRKLPAASITHGDRNGRIGLQEVRYPWFAFMVRITTSAYLLWTKQREWWQVWHPSTVRAACALGNITHPSVGGFTPIATTADVKANLHLKPDLEQGSYPGCRAAVSTEDHALGHLNCISIIWDHNLIVSYWHDGIDSASQLVSASWITWNCMYMPYTRTYSTLSKLQLQQWMKS